MYVIDRARRRVLNTAVVILAASVLTESASAQSATEIGGASPYVAIEKEPPPKLIVDPTPLAAGLAHGIVWIQYRVENVPWGWVEASDNNTISVAGLPPGQHKIRVELVDAEHHVFAGCAECRQTVTLTMPRTESHTH